MTISNAYRKTIKERAVQEFVIAHSRSPTTKELTELLRDKYSEYVSIDQIGFSGYETVKPQYRDVSSVANENQNREAIYDDLFTVSNRLEDLTQLLEDSFRGFQATAKRTNKLLRQVESRLDNLLLLNSYVDVFVHGVEETFDTQDYIDFEKTTASVESGYCTLGRTSITKSDLSNANFSVSAIADKGFIGSQTSTSVNLLKRDDGSVWEHLVYTKQRQGRVSVVIEVDFNDSIYIGDIRFTSSSIGVNQKSTVTLFYSLDGETFTAFEPVETVIKSGENHFNLGIDGVQKIQLMISKNVADNSTNTNNQYVYVFSLDSFKVYSDSYTKSKESVLYAGPYFITDELGQPVNFTKATLDACVVQPVNSSVNFFLSQDGENYKPVSWKQNTNNIVSFGNGAAVSTSFNIDPDKDLFALTETIPGIDEINFATESFLNIGINESYASQVPIRSIVVKRNCVNSGSPDLLYNTVAGWNFNNNDQSYSTTVYIDDPEGREIDFGSSSVIVNGTILTGTVKLQKGYSVIKTDASNWKELDDGIMNIDALMAADSLYPYNHKYLIEGYNYSVNFKGEKLYTGADEFFGALLKYVAPEVFNRLTPDRDNYYKVFTIENIDGNLYFKVKVNKTDALWQEERYIADWIVQSGSQNTIYVKAVIATSNTNKTPMIEDFMIRVI